MTGGGDVERKSCLRAGECVPHSNVNSPNASACYGSVGHIQQPTFWKQPDSLDGGRAIVIVLNKSTTGPCMATVGRRPRPRPSSATLCTFARLWSPAQWQGRRDNGRQPPNAFVGRVSDFTATGGAAHIRYTRPGLICFSCDGGRPSFQITVARRP